MEQNLEQPMEAVANFNTEEVTPTQLEHHKSQLQRGYAVMDTLTTYEIEYLKWQSGIASGVVFGSSIAAVSADLPQYAKGLLAMSCFFMIICLIYTGFAWLRLMTRYGQDQSRLLSSDKGQLKKEDSSPIKEYPPLLVSSKCFIIGLIVMLGMAAVSFLTNQPK